MTPCSDEKDRYQKICKNKSFIPYIFMLIGILPSSPSILSLQPKNLPKSLLSIKNFFHPRSSFKFLSNLFPSLHCQIFQERMPSPLAYLLHSLWSDVHPRPPTEIALFRSALTSQVSGLFPVLLLLHHPEASAHVPTCASRVPGRSPTPEALPPPRADPYIYAFPKPFFLILSYFLSTHSLPSPRPSFHSRSGTAFHLLP